MENLLFYPQLSKYIKTMLAGMDQLAPERKNSLNSIVQYIQLTDSPKLTFICSHNSRRSQLGQIWAKTAAIYFGVEIETFSGGTEVTTFHSNAVSALERAGFETDAPVGTNPIYYVRFSGEHNPLICYSKKYDDESNPKQNFCAIMTCSEADAECPIVSGASEKIKLLYDDPKVADGTPNESERYDERCRQIACEMLFVFSNIL